MRPPDLNVSIPMMQSLNKFEIKYFFQGALRFT